MIGKSDRTIHEWISKFFENGGEIPDSRLGHYQRTGVLWKDESLSKAATRYILSNAAV